jgi:glycosyltransferase involved in cell wall biosynthesis
VRAVLAPPAPAGLKPGPVPTFSIVTAAYQAAGTIAEAVESALAQTIAAHEVIVVDDGSTDSTREALAPYRDRIVYVYQQNHGTAGALNAAARTATGAFVAILDADDVYEPERIEALTELSVNRPDLDILMTDAYLEVDGKIVGRFSERTPFATTAQNVAIFERCFVAWPAVRRERLISVGGFDDSLRIAHDWECWLRLLHHGAAAGMVDEPLMRYRITGQGSLTDDRVAALRDRVTLLELAARLELSADERRELERFLPRRSRRALLAEAEQALRERKPGARRRAFEVALAAGIRPSTRLRALAAALAPRAAARRLGQLEAKTGHSQIRRGILR